MKKQLKGGATLHVQKHTKLVIIEDDDTRYVLDDGKMRVYSKHYDLDLPGFKASEVVQFGKERCKLFALHFRGVKSWISPPLQFGQRGYLMAEAMFRRGALEKETQHGQVVYRHRVNLLLVQEYDIKEG